MNLTIGTRATVSGDNLVRVFDIGEAAGRSSTGTETIYTTRQACIRVLRCHLGRTKRIITEDSPDLFLTVAEVRLTFSSIILDAKRAFLLGRYCPSTRSKDIPCVCRR